MTAMAVISVNAGPFRKAVIVPLVCPEATLPAEPPGFAWQTRFCLLLRSSFRSFASIRAVEWKQRGPRNGIRNPYQGVLYLAVRVVSCRSKPTAGPIRKAENERPSHDGSSRWRRPAGRVDKEKTKHEGSPFDQEDVREVPDHPAQRARLGHLHQSATQATAGVI